MQKQRSLIISGIVPAILFTLVGCGTTERSLNLNKNTTGYIFPSNVIQSNSNSTLLRQTDNFEARSQYKTPIQYANAYAKTLSYRTGTIARAFLEPSIQDQIANGPIGATPWINEWNVSLISQNQLVSKYIYKIQAYQPQKYWAFTSVITVTRYSDGAWIIANQTFKFRPGIGLN